MTNADRDNLLDRLQRKSFDYFRNEVNPANGLVLDRTDGNAPSSIAATGMGLSTYPVGVERGLLTRTDAIQRTLSCLRFFWGSPQGTERDATGYRGFYYHFLDMHTGRRVWDSELSSVDSAFLLAGMLTVAEYFTRDTSEEAEIRSLATKLFERVDWKWMLDGGKLLSHGWTPERGFLPYRWQGYSEALLLYVLALGSRTHAIHPDSYAEWTSTYKWKKLYGMEMLYAGPMFTHQLSHIWIDFRAIQDDFMRERKSDYFRNSQRATELQREYGIRNPMKFTGYCDKCWGLTACDGPGRVTRTIDGVQRRFYDYVSRGAPFGPDDGTISPWAVAASLPFAPEIVLPAIEQFDRLQLIDPNPYGFRASFNQTFADGNPDAVGWIAPGHCGINQGPIVLMIENHRTGLIWKLMRSCRYLVSGLERANFSGGWLE